MDKLDLTKIYKSYFTAKQKPEIIDIEEAQFISITGKGDPSGKPFAEKIETLYTVAYTIKFAFKAEGKDFVVSKLEGLWWFDESKFKGNSIASSSVAVPRSEWEYRLLIRMPEFVTKEHVKKSKIAAIVKKGNQGIEQVQYFLMAEGKCVQMLHVGPFATEPETLKQIGDFMQANNFDRNGLHHELYLSDFRKTPQHKLKTILREPVK